MVLLSVFCKGFVDYWAMRYVGSLEGGITILSEISNVEHMVDHIPTMKDYEELNETDHSTIAEVMAELARVDTIPCMDCNIVWKIVQKRGQHY